MSKYLLSLGFFLLLFINNSFSQPTCFYCKTNAAIDNGLVACYPFNGNANDESGNGFNGTIVSAAALTQDRFANPNAAYSFNGSTQYIRLGDILDSVFARIPIAQFTITGWAKSNTWAPYAGGGMIIGKLSGGGTNGYQWSINHDDNGKVRATVAVLNATNLIEVESPSSIPTNQWFNFTLTFDGTLPETQRVQLYVNNVVGSIYRDIGTLGTTTTNTNQEVTIGAGHNFNVPTTPNNQYSGIIDDIRIYNRVLSLTEIGDIYNLPNPNAQASSDKAVCLGDSVQLNATGGTSYAWSPATGLSNPNIANPYAKPISNQQYIVTISDGTCSINDTVMVTVNTNCCFSCTVPSAPSINTGLVACLPFNGNANDGSGNGNNGTPQAGATLTTDRNNLASTAYSFNGNSNARINIPASASLNTGTMAGFTYACWFNASSSPAFIRRIISIQDASFKNYDLSFDNSVNKLNFINFNGVSDNINFYSKTTFSLNTWYHIALVIDAGNKANLYVNGVLDTFSTINVLKPANPTYTIGNHTTNPWNFVGKIDDIRVYNRNLSASELMQLYLQRDLITITPIPDKTVCLGDSTQLTATGGLFYSWSPATGLSNPNIANPYAKPTANQQYIVTVSNGVCSETDTVMVYVSTDCCFSCTSADAINTGLTFCANLNGNANDATASPVTPTITGSVSLTSDRSNAANQAYTFTNSASTKIAYNSSAKLSVPIGQSFTMSAWFNQSSTTVDQSVITTLLSSDGKAYILFVGGSSWGSLDRKIVFRDYDGPSLNKVLIASANNIQLNTWYHVAITIDKATGLNTLYLNGSVVATVTIPNNSVISTPQFYIGNNSVNAWGMNGKIDEVRMYNRALSQSEIGQLASQYSVITTTPIADKTICAGDSTQLTATGGLFYSWSPATGLSNPNIANPYAKPTSSQQYIVTISNGICSTTDTVMVTVNTNCCATCSSPDAINAGLVACYPFDANVNDASGNNINGTATNITYTTDRFGKANKAISLNGTSSYVDVTNTAFQLSQYTYSVWVNASSVSAAAHSAISIGTNITDQALLLTLTNGLAAVSYNTDATTITGVQTGSVPSLNAWHHVVISRSSTTLSMYVNGTLIASAGVGGKSPGYGGAAYAAYIGRRVGAGSQYFIGKIDDVRIYNRALSAAEVTQLNTLTGPPVITPIIDKTICFGDSVQLTTSGGNTYSWTPATGLSNPNIANPYAKPADSTRYYVTVSNGICSNIDSVNVNVNKTTVTAGPDVTICFRDSIRLGATATPGATFLWTPAGSLNNAGIDSPYAKPTDTTTYRVTATLNGCSATDSTRINVIKVPVDAGSDASICIGDSVRLNATGGTAYAWQQNITLSDTTVSNPYAKPTVTTKYFVYVTNNGCTNTDSVTVNISSGIIVNAGTDTSICLGDSVRLLASGATTYAWWTAPTLNDTSVANPYAKPSDTTTYYVTGKNGACFGTDSVKVNVKKPVVGAGTNQTICKGDSIQLNATGSPGSTFTWTPATSLSNPAIANPYAKPTDTTMYTVVGTSNNCTAKDSVKISVRKVNADAGPAGSVCLGDSIQLNASGGTAYTWQSDPSLSAQTGATPYAKPATPTTYYVTVNDGTCNEIDSVTITLKNVFTLNAGIDTAVCLNDTVQLQASGATTYTWTPATGLSTTIVSNPKANPVFTTDYIVTGLAGVCYETDTVKVTVRSLPVVDLGADTIICEGDAITFLPSVAGANQYSWQPVSMLDDGSILTPTAVLDNGSQLFTLTATNATTGCTNSDEIVVTTHKPTAQFTLEDTTGAAPFVVTPDNTSYPLPLSYEWEILDSIPAYYTVAEPTHTFATAGQYILFLTVTDNRGCFDTISKMVTVSNETRLYVPNVFTPNGDGLNDLFEIKYAPGTIIGIKGTIWNRWGTKIYEFGTPDYKWWDGKAEGTPVSTGVYFYIIEIIDVNGETIKSNGTITIIR